MNKRTPLFGQLLKDLRKKRGWEICQLISAMQYASDKELIEEMEKGNAHPGPRLMSRMAIAFKVDFEYLLEVATKDIMIFAGNAFAERYRAKYERLKLTNHPAATNQPATRRV